MVGNIPLWRLIIHDWSKFIPVEFINCSHYKYGVKSVEKWAKAWAHHMHHNKHHPEHWILSWRGDPDFYNDIGEEVAPFVTILAMPKSFVREMITDMMATSKEVTGSPDIAMWLNRNGPKMQLHDDTITRLDSIMHELGYCFTDNCLWSYIETEQATKAAQTRRREREAAAKTAPNMLQELFIMTGDDMESEQRGKKTELRKAFEIAADALDIAADWSVTNVQVNPPEHWQLPAFGEETSDGWCSTRMLAEKLRELIGSL